MTTSAMGACLSSPKGDDVSASSARTFVGASAKRAGAGDGSAALVDVPLDSPRAEKGTPAPNPEAGANASSTGVEEEAIAVDEVNPFVNCVRGIDGEMLAGMMEAVASVMRRAGTPLDADRQLLLQTNLQVRGRGRGRGRRRGRGRGRVRVRVGVWP